MSDKPGKLGPIHSAHFVARSKPILIGLFALVLGYGIFSALDPINLFEKIESLVDFLAQYPTLFFLGIIVLPGLGIPSTPFFILAGLVYAPLIGPLVTIALITSALTLNILWTHLLAAGPGRRLAGYILRKRTDSLPSLSESNRLSIVCLLRISPLIPLFIQNYFLGFSRVPLSQSLIVGAAAQAVYAALFVIFGKALFTGRDGIILYISLAIVTTFLLGLALHKELKRQIRETKETHD